MRIRVLIGFLLMLAILIAGWTFFRAPPTLPAHHGMTIDYWFSLDFIGAAIVNEVNASGIAELPEQLLAIFPRQAKRARVGHAQAANHGA